MTMVDAGVRSRNARMAAFGVIVAVGLFGLQM
jgi:hypothetical protein